MQMKSIGNLTAVILMIAFVFGLSVEPIQARISISDLQQQIDDQQAQIDDVSDRVEALENAIIPEPPPEINIVVVALDGSGNFTDPVEAVDSITDASVDNPYVVKIMPGIYHIDTNTLNMKPFVDIEGSGESSTKITGKSTQLFTSGIIVGSLNTELSKMTVESSGCDIAEATSTAIYNDNATMSITDVFADAKSFGCHSVNTISNLNSTITMNNVSINALDGLTLSNRDSVVEMTNVSSTASGSGGMNISNIQSNVIMNHVNAINNTGGQGMRSDRSHITINNSEFTVLGGMTWASVISSYSCTFVSMTDLTVTAFSPTQNWGLFFSNTPAVILTDVHVIAHGGDDDTVGLKAYGCNIEMNRITIIARGGDRAEGINIEYGSTVQINDSSVVVEGGFGSNNYGIMSTRSEFGPVLIRINNSSISSSRYALYTFDDVLYEVNNSKLNGQSLSIENLICTDVTDFDDNPLDSHCQ